MNSAELKKQWDKEEREILNDNLISIIKEGLRLIIPPKEIPTWQWAEENITLDDSSAIPGAFRIINSPHLKGILNAFDDPKVRKITIVGSVQFGKTLFMLLCWGKRVDTNPCAIMIMQPTKVDASTFIKTKLDPFIDNNEKIKNKVRNRRKRGTKDTSDSTTYLKFYPGGWTEIINAGSKGATRGRSPKITMGDDISVIDTDVKSEGDPAKNLEKRTTAHKYDYKHINISQPALKGQCRITSRYELGSQAKYHVTCLECGHKQILDDDNLIWEKDVDAFGKIIKHYPETAKIPCQKCGFLFDEKDRIKMLQNAIDDGWVHTYPEMITHRSFELGQINSTLSTMKEIAQERIDMEKVDDEDAKQSYWNTVKGKAYERKRVKETDPLRLMDRNRRDYITSEGKIPEEILLITCAIDVQFGKGEQQSRIEMEVWGWGIGEQGWILDRKKIYGNITDIKDVWQKFSDYYSLKKFIRIDDIQLNISRVFIDSGYESQTVYEYVSDKQHLGFYAIKGSRQIEAPVLPRTANYVYNDRVLLINLGTQKIKHTIYSRLNDIMERGEKFINFESRLCDQEYFEGLTAEHMVTKKIGLIEQHYYEKKKKGVPNEPIDLLAYNYAAMLHCIPNFLAIKESIDKIKNKNKKPVEEPQPTKEANVTKVVRRNNKGYSVDGWRD